MKIEKTITLVRHGATDYNDRDLMQGQLDLPLSKNGIAEAELLRKELKDEKFDIIYHSPLLRAFQTAEIVNKEHGLDYIEIDCFKEINIGDWEGGKFSDVHIKHKDVYLKWLIDAKIRIPGGESYFDVQNRVRDGIKTVLNSNFKNILIFGHLAVNRGILGNLLNIEADMSRKFKLNNCAYSIFHVYKDRIAKSDDIINDSFVLLESWNVTKHLR